MGFFGVLWVWGFFVFIIRWLQPLLVVYRDISQVGNRGLEEQTRTQGGILGVATQAVSDE